MGEIGLEDLAAESYELENTELAFGQADWFERLVFGCLALGALTAFCLAVSISPDHRGHGTHEQLGLPACGMVEAFGMPCPSCGFTTTFALSVRFRWLEAIVNQPTGFLVFLLFCSFPFLAYRVTFRGHSFIDETQHWPWYRILAIAFSSWMLGWLYKIMTF